jgi:hypothetical protein
MIPALPITKSAIANEKSGTCSVKPNSSDGGWSLAPSLSFLDRIKEVPL